MSSKQHLKNKAQSGYYKDYVKHSDESLTIREIWEKTGRAGSLSNAYYVIKANNLPYKKAPAGKGHKFLNQLQELDTTNMTIKEMMGKLGATSRHEYVSILNTLNKHGLKYKAHKFSSRHERELRLMDTANMTVNEISEKLGYTQEWKTHKLYTILPRLGLTYKKQK